MWTVGSTPHANACSHCARPISPARSSPGIAATAALLDMFCGLNGRTRRPRLRAARQSPATSTLLPTSDPVPWSMIARDMSWPLLHRDQRGGDGAVLGKQHVVGAHGGTGRHRVGGNAAPRATPARSAVGSGCSILAGADQQDLDLCRPRRTALRNRRPSAPADRPAPSHGCRTAGTGSSRDATCRRSGSRHCHRPRSARGPGNAPRG